MKIKSLYLTVFALCAMQLFSCKDHTLEEFSLEKADPVTVSAGASSGIVQRDNDKVTIRVGIGLSAPALKAFQVSLELNQDTIATLIANNTLQNTVMLPAGTYSLPNISEIGYGVDSAFFEVKIGVTTLERFYGKKVAMAVSLVDPTKGNQANGARRTCLIVLNTQDIIVAEDIHYVSITNGGGGILNITRGVGYTVTSAGVTIPLGIGLAGTPGNGFTIKTVLNSDTIATLVANGTLPQGTKALTTDKFYADTTIIMPGNKTSVPYVMSIPWNTMDENLDNPIAVAIRIVSTSKHVLHPVNKTVVVLIDKSVSLDNNSYILGDGTGLKAEYFTGQTLDEGGKLPSVTRIDPQIDFDGWQPIDGRGDDWSSKWTGEFLAPVRGEYTFLQDRWDDGSRLFINGVAIINDFTAEWNQSRRQAKITLERGVRYKIEAHHRENVGGQQAKLFYMVPSAGISEQIVPKSQLFPAP
ncbi:PA14 domain-containing protein [Pedobacter sp. BAL39]|uniref:PA14 domain-containing protein n=1 Tax=Pedobacter sp. BAL39 TaxID=391596 RepID=UPI0002DD6777|nr:PA14 domain-containing protein [Pedobacter sp. BAL39]